MDLKSFSLRDEFRPTSVFDHMSAAAAAAEEEEEEEEEEDWMAVEHFCIYLPGFNKLSV